MAHQLTISKKVTFDPSVKERRDPRLIQRKRDGYWFVRFRHKNKTRDKMLGITTPVFADGEMPQKKHLKKYVFEQGKWIPHRIHEKFISEYKLPYIRGTYNPWAEAQNPLFTDVIEEFLSGYREGGHTHRNYNGVLSRFRDHLENPHARIGYIKSEAINAFLASPTLKSSASRESYWRQLRAFFNWAVGQGYIKPDYNPMSEVDKPRNITSQDKCFCMPDDYERVLAVQRSDYEEKLRRNQLSNPYYIIWTEPVYDLAVSLGLRLAELEQLQWQDVNFDLGTIHVRQKTHERDGIDFMPKGKRSRRIEIFPRAERTLKRILDQFPGLEPQNFVLRSPESMESGTMLSINAEKASEKWRHYRREAGLGEDMKFHGLRHLFITYLLFLDYSPFYVQTVAGHRDIATTMGYAHFAKSLVSSRARRQFQERLIEFGFTLPPRVYHA